MVRAIGITAPFSASWSRTRCAGNDTAKASSPNHASGLLCGSRDLRASNRLRYTGQPRCIIRTSLIKSLRIGGRADEAHVSTQHIDELRKLVNAHLADEGFYTGDLRIIRRSPAEHTVLFGINPHAAKLDHVEAAAIQTETLLRVEDRPTILQKDRERGQAQQRRGEQQEH